MENKQTKTLRELIEEYDANGVICIDYSAGLTWVDWDEDIDAEWGGIEMYPAAPDSLAYEYEGDENTLLSLAQYALGKDASVEYASAWVDVYRDEEDSHPYRFRLIF